MLFCLQSIIAGQFISSSLNKITKEVPDVDTMDETVVCVTTFMRYCLSHVTLTPYKITSQLKTI